MGMHLHPQKVRFAAFVILLAALTVIFFLTAPLVWSVLQIFIIAGLLTLALEAPVSWLVRHKVPRFSAVLLLLITVGVLGTGILYLLMPPLVTQGQAFFSALPDMWRMIGEQISLFLGRFPDIAAALDLQNYPRSVLRNGPEPVFGFVQGIFTSAINGITATILVIVTTFYMLLNPWPIVYGLRGLFPEEWWSSLDRIARGAVARLRAWVVGTGALALIVGALDYLALALINAFYEPNIPFVLFFAILGGLLEVIPVIGPIIAAVLPALLGFAIDPLLGVLILGSFTLVQQLENHLIVPLVMHKAVHLHPVSLIIAVVTLSGLFGVFGAVIAVPVAAVMKVIYDEWYYPLLHHDKHPLPAPTDVELEAQQQADAA